MNGAFVLDLRLAADTIPVCDLDLCTVRLMNDARFLWCVLVPRVAGAAELTDLSEERRTQLMKEIVRVSEAMCSIAPCDKLNTGALGNIVRQLHIHVVARVDGDAAWPGPVWGAGVARPYDESRMRTVIEALRAGLSG